MEIPAYSSTDLLEFLNNCFYLAKNWNGNAASDGEKDASEAAQHPVNPPPLPHRLLAQHRCTRTNRLRPIDHPLQKTERHRRSFPLVAFRLYNSSQTCFPHSFFHSIFYRQLATFLTSFFHCPFWTMFKSRMFNSLLFFFFVHFTLICIA